MLKLFISSHGHFASGIKSSVDILAGRDNDITVFDAYVDESSVKERLDRFYANVKEGEQVILLSDLYGGSVNQAMYAYAGRPDTTLIAGVNLALVLELAVREHVTREELEDIVSQSREMLRIVPPEEDEPVPADGEDFF